MASMAFFMVYDSYVTNENQTRLEIFISEAIIYPCCTENLSSVKEIGFLAYKLEYVYVPKEFTSTLG